MKILHTSDWHLGDRLRQIDRREHIKTSLNQIARYLEDNSVDVMLVAGDIFSDRLRAEQRRDAISDIRDIFTPFLARGGSIIAISGNHDNEVFFETLRTAISLLPTGVKHKDGIYNGGFYLTSRPDLVRIRDKDDQIVQFLLMPYPRTGIYLRDEKLNYTNTAEKNRFLQEGFAFVLQAAQQQLNPTQASVLVSHVHVRGAQVHNLFRITENEDVIFEPSQIPAHFGYVAYGHIHKPQVAIPGAEHVRYSGSIARLDLGEREDEKSVVLLEIKNGRRVDGPHLLPLKTTPIYHVDITDLEVLSQLPERFPDHREALVSFTLHYNPALHNRDALMRQVEQIFPNWYQRQETVLGLENGNNPQAGFNLDKPWKETVRGYLQEQLKDDPQLEELLNLADRLLEKEEVEA